MAFHAVRNRSELYYFLCPVVNSHPNMIFLATQNAGRENYFRENPCYKISVDSFTSPRL
jgi:hypothetical protein